tara:strand:+ start:2093 stop:2287 length:195 start_codon:yes stop_codon:yes gene_type:complete
MSESDYNAKSLDATLARIEAKLDIYAVTQARQSHDIEDLKRWRWISVGGSAVIVFLIELVFKVK